MTRLSGAHWLILALLLAGCGFRSPSEFVEKTASSDVGQDDVATTNDTALVDAFEPDLGDVVDEGTPDLPDVSVSFTALTSDVVLNASEATTATIASDDTVFLWVVTFSAMGRPDEPAVAGFELVDVQVAGNRRQLALLRADSADGPLQISFGGQQQDAILWAAVSSTPGTAGEPSSFQSQGTAASVPVIGADRATTGALGGFLVGGMVTPTPDPGFELTGSACGGGACLLTVAGPGPANGVGMSWTGDAPWIGTGVSVRR